MIKLIESFWLAEQYLNNRLLLIRNKEIECSIRYHLVNVILIETML